MRGPDRHPTAQECEAAVARAITARADRYRIDPAFAGVTPASIAERVTGTTVQPKAGRDGWWHVGHILDVLGNVELDVWYRPRGLAVSRREALNLADRKPSISRYYNDGQHGWVDSETGQPAPMAEVRRMLGVHKPK